jgi:hypothetical protein
MSFRANKCAENRNAPAHVFIVHESENKGNGKIFLSIDSRQETLISKQKEP